MASRDPGKGNRLESGSVGQDSTEYKGDPGVDARRLLGPDYLLKLKKGVK